MTAQQVVNALNMMPHPEGGFYVETYRHPKLIQLDNGLKRNLFTSIYYMLTPGDFSHFHRLKSDEIWFFHAGTAVKVHMLQAGKLTTNLVGNIPGTLPQLVIPAETWFAAEMTVPEYFSLVSCTVSPGFEFDDFEIATAQRLTAEGWDMKEIPEKLILKPTYSAIKNF